ncbi:MAG TPA: hypothetical protein IAC62_06705 [Candidatus Pelethocola excrementipullorum]|nr:hypothetical protein [Candidatus Pelethocola excrementipullorum]
MKKKLCLAVLCTLTLSFAACGNNVTATSSASSTSTSETSEEEQQTTDTSEEKEQATDTSGEEQAADISLSGLEAFLLEKGVITGARTEIAAEMVGAVSGFKYADTGAEFYEYDTNSDAYKTLSETGSIELQGMEGFNVTAVSINGSYVLIASSGTTLSQELIDAFNSFGK